MSDEENEKKYTLYAGRVQDIPRDVTYSFIPSHHQYLLIYSDKHPEPVEEFIVVDESLLQELTPEESAWLSKCMMQIDVQRIEKNKQDAINIVDSFLDVFEKQLLRESKQVGKKRTGGGNDKTAKSCAQNNKTSRTSKHN